MASFKKNYLYQVLYEILAIGLPLITAPYISRVLGAENLGIFSYTHSVANLFLMIARLGIVNHGSRCIAAHQKDYEQRSRVFSELLTIQTVVGILVTLAYVVYTGIFITENKLVAFVQTIFVATTLFDIGWLYMGMENFKKTVTRNMFVKFFSLICIFLFVRNRTDIILYTAISTVSMLLGHLTLWRGLKKIVKWVAPTFDSIKKQFADCLVMFIPTIAVTIYTVIDKIILGNMSGSVQVGYYDQAAKLVSVPLGFITSFGAVMLPRMSAMTAEGASEEQSNKITSGSLVFMVAVATAVSFGLASVSKTLIPVYYGPEFLACIPLLVLISIKLPIMAWANVIRTQCLIPKHRDKEYIISLFVGAFVNLGLNFLLTPKYAAIGAAIATVTAETAVCLVQSFYVKDVLNMRKPLVQSAGFIVIGFIMMAAVKFVESVVVASTIALLCIEIVVGGIVFVVLAGAFACAVVLKKSPVVLLKSLLKKK